MPVPCPKDCAALGCLGSTAKKPPTPSPMTIDFEELDYQITPIGALILRRRMERSLGVVVYEIMSPPMQN